MAPALRRRTIVLCGLAALAIANSALAAARPRLVIHKSPSCGCCGAWTALMRRAGFDADIHDTDDLEPIWRKAGLSAALTSCHTAFVEGYVVEGHVPPGDVLRLLAERPAALGLAVPGMPPGAPGMGPPGGSAPFDTLIVLRDGRTRVFAHHA